MGKREVRMSRLVEVINSCGYMPIKELAQMFHVSEMTIRRDLAAVERSGLVKTVNGVVVNTNKSARSIGSTCWKPKQRFRMSPKC